MDPTERPPIPPLSMRGRLGSVAGRAAGRLSRALGRGDGTVIGGIVASRVDPRFLRRLTIGKTVVLLSGTNGKTTTSHMTATALATAGPVAFNADGSNMEPGLVMTLARDPHAPTVLLEVDEAILGLAVRNTRPRAIMLLNLSREYTRGVLMRDIARHWKETLASIDWPCTIVANADDPLIVDAVGDAPDVVWVAGGMTWPDDSQVCPRCLATTMTFEGTDDWHCDGCGLRRPTALWSLQGETIHGPTGAVDLHLGTTGRWTRGNALFAVATAATLGVDPPRAVEAIGGITNVRGRYAPHDIDGRETRVYLVKNPSGWREALSLAIGGHPIVFAMETFGVKDMAPPWDVAFDGLRSTRVAIGGQRSRDLAVVLALHGIPFERFDDPIEAIRSMPPGPVDVIANYTAFVEFKHRFDH
jgi:UDP-N-acetylmuramyl tripeptide synthase